MTRADLFIYLSNTLKRPAAQAKVQNTDAPDGYRYVLDDVFRALGVAEASLATASVDDAKTGDAQALARYFALNTFLDNISPEQDMVATQMRSSRTQPYAQMQKRLELATAEVIRRGYGQQLGLLKTARIRPMGTV